MYVFVRFSGIVIIVFGLLFMLLGFGGAVYVLIQNDALVQMINSYTLTNSKAVLQQTDLRLYAVTYGLILFLAGMIVSALGQLLLVFVDIAVSTRETSILLRRRDVGSG
jgi:hypothetical protein